jgi:hypothetical protein
VAKKSNFFNGVKDGRSSPIKPEEQTRVLMKQVLSDVSLPSDNEDLKAYVNRPLPVISQSAGTSTPLQIIDRLIWLSEKMPIPEQTDILLHILGMYVHSGHLTPSTADKSMESLLSGIIDVEAEEPDTDAET